MSQTYASINATDKSIIPIGFNLNNVATQTKIPSAGALAYDAGTTTVYFGASGPGWLPLGSGSGVSFAGTTPVTIGTIATFANTTGTAIQNTTIGISGGNLTGVTGINGKPIPSQFGNVSYAGMSAAINDHLATYATNDNGTG